MSYRVWQTKDLAVLAEMEREIFPKTAWSYRMLEGCLQSDAFYGVCCEENGSIVGYGSITRGVDEAEIDNLGLLQGYRGEGRGKALMGLLLKKAREWGAKKVFLEVRVSNTPALLLYLKAGFHGLYARPRYYPDGEDALVMCKEF